MIENIIDISLSELHLWTENPRDPIDFEATDEQIIIRAIESNKNWDLDKMLNEMGDFYDYSELPIVVEEDNRYVVYDGNRRIAVMKCLQNENLYSIVTGKLPLFSKLGGGLTRQLEISCAVYDRETALKCIERKHRGSTRWGSLEYEYFQNIHRGQPKGILILFEEASGGLVSNNPKLNEEYVQNRLLTERNLNDVGLAVIEGRIETSHSENTTRELFQAISDIRTEGISDARKNAGQLRKALEELDPAFRNLPKFDVNGTHHPVEHSHPVYNVETRNTKLARRTPATSKNEKLFGGTLELVTGRTNDMYRAICDIYTLYEKNADKNSHILPILCMSMRLLFETAAHEYYYTVGIETVKPIPEYFKLVRSELNEQLSEMDINNFTLVSAWLNGEEKIEAMLQKWAHGSLAADRDLVIRMSQILAVILSLHHSKKRTLG
ncbi:MAG: hypothetical protein FWH40_07745 [Coriobacteriia bacterium]|nr:hypothetical protein [Coriobacteriia bacterium]